MLNKIKVPVKTRTTIKVPNITVKDIVSKVQCDNCFKYYASAKSLTNHLALGRCTVLQNEERDQSIAKKVANILFEKQSEQLAQQAQYLKEIVNVEFTNLLKSHDMKVPTIHNHQNLNVMCVGSKDNLLDILTQQTDLPLALAYIKDAVLGKSAGDCRILKKVYFPNGKRPAIMYKGNSKTQFVYYDEKNEKIVGMGITEMAKKLADILQRTYSKSINELRTDICDNVRENHRSQSHLLPQLEPYDIQIWHHHIQELQDGKYQKELLKALNIPTEKEVQSRQLNTD